MLLFVQQRFSCCRNTTLLSLCDRRQLTKRFALLEEGIDLLLCSFVSKEADIHSDFRQICDQTVLIYKGNQSQASERVQGTDRPTVSDGLQVSAGEKAGFDGSPGEYVMANEC